MESLVKAAQGETKDVFEFYKGKRVLVTGHTGFKGAWLCKLLCMAGSDVTGYALRPPTSPSLFALLDLGREMCSVIGDIRDAGALQRAFERARPEVVFHLAAQPLVLESYRIPADTYAVNVMGTVHVLECVRLFDCVRSLLNVTTDKVYENREWEWGYRETDSLDGFDPYSNSKSCSELVTRSYAKSFFTDERVAVSTARAGNVIGGGDFAGSRIIPDCVRAAMARERIMVRNALSVRPYQHVLEPLYAYMTIAQKQFEDGRYAGSYNIGPDESDCVATGALVRMFCVAWQNGLDWADKTDPDAPHETRFLKLDCSRMKSVFGWKPRWDVRTAIEKTVDWTKAWLRQEDLSACMERQIMEFLAANIK